MWSVSRGDGIAAEGREGFSLWCRSRRVGSGASPRLRSRPLDRRSGPTLRCPVLGPGHRPSSRDASSNLPRAAIHYLHRRSGIGTNAKNRRGTMPRPAADGCAAPSPNRRWRQFQFSMNQSPLPAASSRGGCASAWRARRKVTRRRQPPREAGLCPRLNIMIKIYIDTLYVYRV